ncbi:CaiB/BaiF CoA transferase family protein [Sphaerimonospora mesophila]|uniref:CaiB/BaiF CoA transferase family protein n=1 Tax=Sphaerimonospora mesophila TaxID=37483 RepID=UPI0006E397F4
MDRETFYRDARGDLPGPLHGVRVLDLTKVWSGPYASSILADLGADVIRVEMPGNREGQALPELPGTGLPWWRQIVHRGKRSIGLDLRKQGAAEVFLRLVASADVLLENYKPGTLAAWGVGYEQCRAVRPDLVFVSVSGFGQYGPHSRRPGYDPAVQAAAGWMSLNGEPDGGPLKAPTFLADDLAGLHAVIGALAALRHRDATGEGQHVDVSMLDAMLATSDGNLTLAATGARLERTGNAAGFVVPAGAYGCADGHVYIAIGLDKEWRAFAEELGRPELGRAAGFATNAERVANREAVDALVGDWCAGRTAEQVEAALTRRGLTAQRVRSFAEVAKDPHVAEREMLQETRLSNGSAAPLTGPAVKFSRTPSRVRAGAPEPGAHTAEILDGLGLDGAARARLRDLGAI